ncbi:thiol-activated cytolysin family protein [Sphingobacterium thalpophilum]|uniref:Thiol-activated cytolysin n=1 Tax=Sphingobacterium thalpophilum TaxID=259 RepID=A0A4U9UWQ7_9SPHI|nr:thiol-activated cytolysin family protein [Sphingobacterium thalpophilum]VTR37547.1 Thiol-activated cytolysin [Sphingobacterium thalpophilum]
MRRKLYILSVLFLLVLSGCKKDKPYQEKTDLQKSEKKLLSSYFKDLKIQPVTPVIIESKKFGAESSFGPSKKAVLTHLRDTTTPSGVGTVSYYESDEMIITPSNASYIYPGAILKASSIATDKFETLFGYDRAPISVQLSFPSSKSFGTIPTASLADSRMFLRDALMAPDFSGKTIVDFTQYFAGFNRYEEVKLAFGYNVNEKKLFSSTNTSFNESSNSTRYYSKYVASYTVKNFTFDMSDPVEGELIDIKSIPPDVFSGFSPVYINSVTYGRFGILVLESNKASSDMQTVFEKVVKKILKKTTESYTEEEKSLFAGSRITIYLLGSKIGSNTVQLLLDPDPENLSDFISENVGTFTASDPGVPISYTAKYLKDNSKFKTIFNIQRY